MSDTPRRARPGIERYESARKVQRTFAARERDEWRRIAAQQFRYGKLDEWERKIFDGGPPPPRPVGAPSTFELPHQFIAKHYCWLKAEQRLVRTAAEKAVAAAWGVSTGAVRKAVEAHRTTAEGWARQAIDESAGPSPLTRR